MSNPTIKSILQSRLYAMPEIQTAWENTQNNDLNTPYQRVFFLGAAPIVRGFSERVHSGLNGIMQVSLYYEAGKGTGDIDARIEAIRQQFYAGWNEVKDGWQVIIQKLASASSGDVLDGEYVVHVSVHYQAFEL